MSYDLNNMTGRDKGLFSSMVRWITRESGLRIFGAIGIDYELHAPTTGTTYNVPDDVGGVYFNHSATIATLTVVMPPTPEDGQEVNLAFRSIVTTLTLNGSGSDAVVGKVNPTANSNQRYRYWKSDATWRRID